MAYRREYRGEYEAIIQDHGPTLGTAADTPIIEQDGYCFKDLAHTGKLLPYEDWRLSAKERAADLASRLSREEIAGLMLYSSHQCVPFHARLMFSDTYGGKPFEESGADPWALSDAQKLFLERDHIRHILQMSVDSAEISARWSNALQRFCEQAKWGIPVNISTDPRHGADEGGAEFRTAGKGVSKWPEGIGFTSAGDPELVRQFAKIAAKEYRALGITTALGPQIDLSTEPRWMRLEDTLGSDPEKVIPMVKAYCDGMQTTEGAPDGWGKDSVITMVKHWPGGGTGEGGRDAHYAYGCFAVYPAGKAKEHLRPFTEGAFQLDGPTKRAGAVMPYYTVSWNLDAKDGENVGNSYSHYILNDLLREKYDYDGVVCTDWGITGDPLEELDAFGPRCYGVQNLSVAERHLRIILNGADQFGGNNDAEPILEAWRIGDARYGEAWMRERMELSATRLLTGIFRLGLFENPYLDPEESARIVGQAEFVKAGLAAQARSMVLLKNRQGILPLRKGIRVYIPDRHYDRHKVFFRTWAEASDIHPFSEDLSPWLVRVSTPEEADVAIVRMESPLSTAEGYLKDEREATGSGYLPIQLQYRPYTAVEARAVSIAGGDFREASANRTYRGKTASAYNESDLDNLIAVRKAIGDKPIVVSMRMHKPLVPSEWEPLADAVLLDFGATTKAVMDALFGVSSPTGKLPYNLPKDMAAVERHSEDAIEGPEPYTAGDGSVYEAGYSAYQENKSQCE